jgi:Tol biopolymer transport system component
MTELKERFRALTDVRPPNLWPDIERRDPRSLREGPSTRRLVAAAVAFTVAAAGIGFAAYALRKGPTEPKPAAAVRNGKIAFLRYVDGGESVQETQADIYVVNPDGTGEIRLTEDTADDLWPAWSPDGSKIAFISTRDEAAFDLYVMNADSTGVTRLLRDGTGVTDPAWSPDGIKIAFESGRGGSRDIWLINSDGSGLTRLTDHPAMDEQPAWSPDGSRIAFVSRRDGIDDPNIYVMNADGTGETRLSNHEGVDFRPAWSPDGTRIAFESDADIYVMNADGSGLMNLTDDLGEDRSPAWSPDGTKIAFETNRDGNFEIYVMNGDATGLTRITDTPTDEGSPAWQPILVQEEPAPLVGVRNGRIAFVVGHGGTGEIYVVNPDGTDETLLVEGRDPAWSPDGTQIAYRTGNPNRPGGLEAAVHIVKADGTNPRRFEFEGLGEASGEAGPPVWSPDGSLIAFDTLDGIYVVRPDRTGLRRVSRYQGEHACYDLEPSWSPDGTRLVFAVLCEGGSEGIWTVNADGSGRTQLIAGDYETTDYRYPAWSPDGTKIAFVGLTGGPSEFAWHIYVMSPDGSDVVRLTDGPGTRGTPAWSPDGTKIAFTDFTTGQLFVMQPDGTGLAPIPGIREGCCPAWQPVPAEESAPTESPAPTKSTVEPPAARVAATIPVGSEANVSAVAVGEGGVWVAARDSNGVGYLLRVDPESNRVVATIPTEASPGWEFGGGGLIVEAGSVWVVGSVANERGEPGGVSDAAIVRVDPTSNRIEETVRLEGNFAADVAVDESGIWVLVFPDEGNMDVVRLDPASLQPTSMIELGSRYARQIFEAAGSVWVHEKRVHGSVIGEPVLTRLDPTTGELVPGRPMDIFILVFAPSGDSIWGVSADSVVSDALIRIDPATGEPVGEPLTVPGLGLFAVPTEEGLWVSRVDPETKEPAMVLLDPETGNVRASVAVEGGPIAGAADEQSLWVLTYEGSLIRIDLR